jgi:hypothetical protein
MDMVLRTTKARAYERLTRWNNLSLETSVTTVTLTDWGSHSAAFNEVQSREACGAVIYTIRQLLPGSTYMTEVARDLFLSRSFMRCFSFSSNISTIRQLLQHLRCLHTGQTLPTLWKDHSLPPVDLLVKFEDARGDSTFVT